MENLNDIFRTFGPEYLVRFGDDIPREHRKVIDAICECRTEEAGIALYVAARKVDVPRGFHGGRAGKPVVEPDLVLRTVDGRVHPEYATIRLAYGFPPGDADPDER